MYRILGEASGNSAEIERLYAEIERLYAERFLNCRKLSRHFNHQLWIGTFVCILLFPYQISKK
jgi:hypothetical protein